MQCHVLLHRDVQCGGVFSVQCRVDIKYSDGLKSPLPHIRPSLIGTVRSGTNPLGDISTLHCITVYSAWIFSAVKFSAVQCSAVLCSAVQCSAAQDKFGTAHL